ncbi:hypothetical protein BD408DRAFT_281003 [Parasitella parasitica]|nr:hypothetical protein BD408DRAFT_281003 [Parasitella parasitica]
MYVPASRPCRSRLVRYRMGWLPGKPRPCVCNTDHTSRRHLDECPSLPPLLISSLPTPPDSFHGTIIDHALNLLTFSSPNACNNDQKIECNIAFALLILYFILINNLNFRLIILSVIMQD